MKSLLADDHALFRDGIKRLLIDLDAGVEIVEAQDGADVLRWIEVQQDFDLILLDIAMPGINGLQVLATLRQRLPATPVAMMSASDSGIDVRAALAAGAAGYIPKTARGEIMLSALRLILAGGVYLPPMALSINTPCTTDNLDALTSRQRDVLKLLEQGQSNKEIGRALNLTEGTVKQHVSAILKALNASTRMQVVLAAGKRAIKQS